MKKRLLFLLPLLLVVALFVFFEQGLKQDPHLLPSTRLSKQAPPFVLTLLGANKTVTEKIFLHHFSLLVVFASWCETCAQEQSSQASCGTLGQGLHSLYLTSCLSQ